MRYVVPLMVAIGLFVHVSRLNAEHDSPPIPSQEELEKAFQDKLTGATLIGSFTDNTADPSEAPSQDKYVMEKVTKGKNGFWLFEARIQYGDRDQKFSMPLKVEWAGDTPVISVTDVLVPGMGVFTARVLFYGDQYAGTWSAKDHGGQMFGRIVKEGEEGAAAATSE